MGDMTSLGLRDAHAGADASATRPKRLAIDAKETTRMGMCLQCTDRQTQSRSRDIGVAHRIKTEATDMRSWNRYRLQKRAVARQLQDTAATPHGYPKRSISSCR